MQQPSPKLISVHPTLALQQTSNNVQCVLPGSQPLEGIPTCCIYFCRYRTQVHFWGDQALRRYLKHTVIWVRRENYATCHKINLALAWPIKAQWVNFRERWNITNNGKEGEIKWLQRTTRPPRKNASNVSWTNPRPRHTTGHHIHWPRANWGVAYPRWLIESLSTNTSLVRRPRLSAPGW